MTYDDTRVFIRNGKYISGTLNKKSLGNINGSLIHVSFLELGAKITMQFFTE